MGAKWLPVGCARVLGVTANNVTENSAEIAWQTDMAGDSLLIAGKGHEPYQEFADTVVPFDDRMVARELIGIKRISVSN